MKRLKLVIPLFLIFALTLACGAPVGSVDAGVPQQSVPSQIARTPLQILATSEIKLLEDAKILDACKQKTGVQFSIEYRGSVELKQSLDLESAKSPKKHVYIVASPMWMTQAIARDKVSIMQSVGVMVVDENLASQMKWSAPPGITIAQVLAAAESQKLSLAMPSASQDDMGANLLLAAMTSLKGDTTTPLLIEDVSLGSPVLKKMETLYKAMKASGSNADRVREVMLKDHVSDKSQFNAAFLPEAMAIALNTQLIQAGKPPMRVFYVQGAVALQTYTAGYIDGIAQGQIDQYHELTNCLRSPEIQDKIRQQGFRATYVGITMPDADEKVFNPAWGVNTKTEFSLVLLPKEAVIAKALEMYQTALRPPSFTVYCLDYSGSMGGEGITQLRAAMKLLLTESDAAKELLQASPGDMTYALPFESNFRFDPDKFVAGNDPVKLADLYDVLKNQNPNGGTNIYGCAKRAIELVQKARSDQIPAIILMTDGDHNGSVSYLEFKDAYDKASKKAPIYSVMFGGAKKDQLDLLAKLSGGAVCDGRGGVEVFTRCFKIFKGNN